MSPILNRFKDFYRELTVDSIESLGELYDEKIEFCDPAHCTHGLPELSRYFANTMSNVEYCAFDIHEVVEQPGSALVTWTMQLRHPKLNGGKDIRVPGSSHLKFADKIHYHRDYFDLGAMLYEHIPLLGAVVRALKNKLNG